MCFSLHFHLAHCLISSIFIPCTVDAVLGETFTCQSRNNCFIFKSMIGKDYVVIEADSKNAADNILHTEEEIKDAIDKSSLIMLTKPPKSIAKVIQK